MRTWLLLLPYGFAYLGLSAFCSACVKQPSLALILALGLMVGLRLIGDERGCLPGFRRDLRGPGAGAAEGA
jgi:hypothetical protein